MQGVALQSYILQDFSLIRNTPFNVDLSLAIIVALSVNNYEQAAWWKASDLYKAAEKKRSLQNN